MKKLIIVLLLLIAFVGCTKEDVLDGCGLGCEVVAIEDSNCGRIIGGATVGLNCEFGYIIIEFNNSNRIETICLIKNDPNISEYTFGNTYCVN